MVIHKTILVIWPIRQVFCNSHFVAPGFFDNATCININLEIYGGI